jgi:hypothetical protein
MTYYDFSGLNSITTNNYYYYETSHFRPVVGDMMLNIMFQTPEIEVPGDFGFRVSSVNVDTHLKKQCKEIHAAGNQLNSINSSFAETCEKVTNHIQSALSSQK